MYYVRFYRSNITSAEADDTPADFIRRSGHFPRSCLHFEKSCDKIAQPDWLTLVAIRSDERKKSRERAHLANLIADI